MISLPRPGRGASPQPQFIRFLEVIFKKAIKVEPCWGKYPGMKSHGLSCGSTSRILGERPSKTTCVDHLCRAWTFLSFWERIHGFCGDKVTCTRLFTQSPCPPGTWGKPQQQTPATHSLYGPASALAKFSTKWKSS